MELSVHSPWLGEYVLRPYLEGTERLNRAWFGINFHSLQRRPLSWKDRTVACITGLALLFPFINTIIWVYWKTFAHPEVLSDLRPEKTDL